MLKQLIVFLGGVICGGSLVLGVTDYNLSLGRKIPIAVSKHLDRGWILSDVKTLEDGRTEHTLSIIEGDAIFVRNVFDIGPDEVKKFTANCAKEPFQLLQNGTVVAVYDQIPPGAVGRDWLDEICG